MKTELRIGESAINFNQEFSDAVFLFTLYKYNVYATPTKVKAQNNNAVEYFSIIDTNSGVGDYCFVGVHWRKYRVRPQEIKMFVRGDEEMFNYLKQALFKKLMVPSFNFIG